MVILMYAIACLMQLYICKEETVYTSVNFNEQYYYYYTTTFWYIYNATTCSNALLYYGVFLLKLHVHQTHH
jgi:hypothetical protein